MKPKTSYSSAVGRMPTLISLALLALLAGCGRDEAKSSGVNASFDAASELPALGVGDVEVRSTDRAFVMAVVGDTVRMHLSDSLRNSVDQEIDTSIGTKGGLGATIANSVKKVVQGAMGTVVRVPVNEIENLRYEDGHIRFGVRNGMINVNTSTKGSSESAMFSESDANTFIDAVRARQGKKPHIE